MKSFIFATITAVLLFSSTTVFASSSIQDQVNQARKDIKNAAFGYVVPAQDGKLATSRELYPLLDKAKASYEKARKALLKSTVSNKKVLLKELDSLYIEKVDKGIVPYIDAYNYAEKYLATTLKEMKQAEMEQDWSKLLTAYHKLSFQLKSKSAVLYRFSGKDARDLLLEKYKNPANAKRDQLAVAVTVYMKAIEADNLINAGKVTEAHKSLSKMTALLKQLPAIGSEPLLEFLAEVSEKAGYDLVLPAHLKDGASVFVFAGSGDYGNTNGEAASFRTPNSIASLSDGSILVADSKNQTIRMIKSGVVSTYAGITFETDTHGNPQGGWHDDKNDMSVFNNPTGMAIDKNDTVFIADTDNNVIRKITKDGNVTTVAGDGFIGNQDGVNARFNYPQDVAFAKDGTLYVADTLNHVIRKITTDGKVSTLNAYSDRVAQIEKGDIELAGDYADGKLPDAKFNEPSALVIDEKGNLYVSDSGNQLIRYIDFTSNTVSTVAGNVSKSSTISESSKLYANGDYVNGSALSAQFNFPKGLAITSEGGLLIADSLNHAIRYLVDGKVTTVVGATNGSKSPLYYPTDILVLPDGFLLVVDSYSNSIRIVEPK